MHGHGALLALHLLAAVVWVGGMFFAYTCLRPAAVVLEPPARCTLWHQVLRRFFVFVSVSVLAILLSGYLMLPGLGGLAGAGPHVHLMHALGWVMVLLFGYVYLLPFRRLGEAVAGEAWPVAAAQIGRIRTIVATNLALGLLVVAVAASGRYWT